ncbi:hypothetical protein TNCV_3359311 [Trichonephila clavipes]|nr:hypothetical protein TNCV_3359311 [Trichonephila clavipes]
MANIPYETSLKIKEKNRLRKLWKRMQYPPIKVEINWLQGTIHAELKKVKEHVWDSLQTDKNIDYGTLHKIITRENNKNISYSPLLGFPKSGSWEARKSRPLCRSLEELFTENRTPNIDKVDRTVQNFLNSYNTVTPPLPSPQEVCGIISKLDARKAPDQEYNPQVATNERNNLSNESV